MKGRIGDSGRRAEKDQAKRLDGRATMGSGALAGDKGDIVLDKWLIECKSTTGDKLTIKLDWLAKIAGEALGKKGRRPALNVLFVDESGKVVKNGDWMMVPTRLWKEMSDALDEVGDDR